MKRTGDEGLPICVKTAGDVEALRQWIEVNPGIKMVEVLGDGCRALLESESPEDIAACKESLCHT